MVHLSVVHESNARISQLPEGLVALFLGGTSGIGQNTLIQLATHAVKPRIYIVARRASAIDGMIATLRTKNPHGEYIVIEKNVSLLRETTEVIDFVKARETKLDLLFESVGFISFDGRQETAEGLDTSMATQYYSRILAVYGLLPLLDAAASPRVVSILAGGQETKLNEDDLDLRKPGSYSIANAAHHSSTMLTLSYEHVAREHPKISFVHAYPGPVATPILSRGSTGLKRVLLTWIVTPLIALFSASPETAGARALFLSTSSRYAVGLEHSSVPLASGVAASPKTKGGVFLSDGKSESTDNEKVLADLRARGTGDKVWKHTMDIFDACAARTQ